MRLSKELGVVLASVASYFLAVQLVASVIARYSRDLGIGIAATSTLWSIVPLVSLVLRPFSGYVADRTSSFLAMAVGGVFTAAASLAYAASHDMASLAAARVLHGVGGAFFISPSIAAVATVAGEYAGLALGLRSMLISLGSLVSPVIAGVIVDSYGYVPVFLLAALLAIVVVVLNAPYVRRRVGEGGDGSWREALNRTVLILMAVAVCGGGVFMTVSGLLQAHYRDLGYGAKYYGYFMAFFGVASLATRYVAGRLSMRMDPGRVALAGYSIVALSIALLRWLYWVPASFVVAILYGAGLGLTVPTIQLMAVRSAPERARNRAVAVYAMGFDLGGFIAPNVFGYMAAAWGYETSYAWLVALPLVAAAVLGYLTLSRSSRTGE